METSVEKMNRLFDATARIDRVIYLAGALAAMDAFPDDLKDFFDEEDTETIEKALGPLPEWFEPEESASVQAEFIFEWLRDAGKLGFLVQFATPVMTPHGSSRSFSWGYYSTRWVYADTMDEAIAKGLEWCEEQRAAEDRKADKKGGA